MLCINYSPLRKIRRSVSSLSQSQPTSRIKDTHTHTSISGCRFEYYMWVIVVLTVRALFRKFHGHTQRMSDSRHVEACLLSTPLKKINWKFQVIFIVNLTKIELLGKCYTMHCWLKMMRNIHIFLLLLFNSMLCSWFTPPSKRGGGSKLEHYAILSSNFTGVEIWPWSRDLRKYRVIFLPFILRWRKWWSFQTSNQALAINRTSKWMRG